MERVELLLDADDARDVRAALAVRRGWATPDGESNEAGALVAEVCRGWLELLEMARARGRPCP